MQQDYPEGNLPLVGRHVIERIELETGETLPPTVDQKILEGSYSTKLTVRCDGQRVRVEGNPSRWQRMDNLFGFQTLDECVGIYNHVLQSLGLPSFTKNTRIYQLQSSPRKKVQLVGNGAEITGIDWTINHQVGQGNELSFIRAMSVINISRGRPGNLYPNGHTCDWGAGSTWMMTKLYNKAFELRTHLKKGAKNTPDNRDARLEYIENLITYCESQGVVREEHSIRQAFLKRHNLQFYGAVTEQDFYPHLKYFENAMNTIQISRDIHQTIADQLLEKGIVKSRQAANATQNYAMAWQHGENLRTMLSERQFYEHKARLKAIGYDIGQQFDVTRMCFTLRRSDPIQHSLLALPDWYQLPKVAQSNVLPFKAVA